MKRDEADATPPGELPPIDPLLPPIEDEDTVSLESMMDEPVAEDDAPLLSDELADEEARDDEFEQIDSQPLDFDDAPPMRRN